MDRPGNLMDYLSINPLDQPAENDLRKLIKYYFIWYSHNKINLFKKYIHKAVIIKKK